MTIILLLLFSNDLVVAQSRCELRKNKDSIKVYVCQTNHAKIKIVRASFTMNSTYSEIVATFLDVENFSTWQYKTKCARVLKHISDSKLIYYAEIEVPWPLLNRDIILEMEIIQDPSIQCVTINCSALPEYIESMDNLVRVRTFHSAWTFKAIDKNKVEAEYVRYIDAGGLPSWLSNTFAALGPYETFLSLKKQVRSSKLSNSLIAGSKK